MPLHIKNYAMEAKPAAARGSGDSAGAKHGGGGSGAGGRSRFKRLLVRVAGDGREKEEANGKVTAAAAPEAEPTSVGLDKMVLSFIEESNERQPRGRCNCFNGNYEDSSDDEFDFLPSDSTAPPPTAAGDAVEILKSLVQSASIAERNLLADASKILEKSKSCKSKSEFRSAVTDGLKALGYDAAVCKSQWEKTSSYPAGEHEYVDAVVDSGQRLIVEIDFRSEFEVARSTKAYRAALQSLPSVYVGTADRLGKIVAVVVEAARQSLKKKGLHFPPWRKTEYMRAKWLSPHARCTDAGVPQTPEAATATSTISAPNFSGELQLRFDGGGGGKQEAEERITVVVSPWRPAEAEAKKPPKAKLVTGLASVL